jgi:hypothetical protein
LETALSKGGTSGVFCYVGVYADNLKQILAPEGFYGKYELLKTELMFVLPLCIHSVDSPLHNALYGKVILHYLYFCDEALHMYITVCESLPLIQIPIHH